jgi:predicted DNA-binding protein YlxM (UPF0122 family)
MFRQVNLNPPKLHEYDSNISTYFSDTVAAMLEKNPANRPSEEELEEVLKNLIEYNKTREVKHEVIRRNRSLEQIASDSARLLEHVETEEFKMSPFSDMVAIDHSIETMAQHIEKLEMFKKQAKRKKIRDKLGEETLWEKILNPSMEDLKVAGILLGTLIVTIFAGVIVHWVLFSSKLDESITKGPLIAVVCTKCSAAQDLYTNNPDEEKCRQCKARMAVAMKCYKCNKLFPRQPIPSRGNMNLKEYNKLLGKLEKCSLCGSTDVEAKQPTKN